MRPSGSARVRCSNLTGWYLAAVHSLSLVSTVASGNSQCEAYIGRGLDLHETAQAGSPLPRSEPAVGIRVGSHITKATIAVVCDPCHAICLFAHDLKRY